MAGHLEVNRSTRAERLWPQWLFVVVVLLAASVVLYGNIMGSFFVGDDFEVIWRATAFDPDTPVLGHVGSYWRPLTGATVWVNHLVAGDSPSVYHLTNVVVHALVGSMLYLAAMVVIPAVESRQVRGSDRAVGVFAATLFVAVPSHGEAVVWISGRFDLLMALFGLGSLVSFVALQASGAGWSMRRRLLVGMGSVVMLAAALLAKESAVAVPLIAVLLDLARRRSAGGGVRFRSQAWSAFRSSAPLLAVTVLWFIVRLVELGSVSGGFYVGGSALDPFAFSARMGAVVLRSAVPAMSVDVWLWIAGPILIALVFAALLFGRNIRRFSGTQGAPPSVARNDEARLTALVFLACAIVAAGPVGMLGVSFTTIVGERLTYLPSVFVVLAASRIWGVLYSRRARVALWTATGLLCTAAIWTWFGLDQWRAAGIESSRLVDGLATLVRDEPATVFGVRERTDGGVPVALNAVRPAVVLFHGWTDPDVIVAVQGAPLRGSGSPNSHLHRSVWLFDGRRVRLIASPG